MSQLHRTIMQKISEKLQGSPYEQCRTSDDNGDPLLDEERLQSTPKLQHVDVKNNHSAIAISLVSCSVLGILAGYLAGRAWAFDPEAVATKVVSNYSPMLEDIDISYNTVRFNGSLMHENIFRQDASPEVDAAWQSLGVDYRSIIVPASLAAPAGLAPDQVKVNSKYGGGYPANVEGLHHLHCLNLLRQSLYYNYEYYHSAGEGAFKNDDNIVRVHVSHCLDILRQQLMCTVDIGVLGQVWWNTEAPTAYVDFNTEHKCRNFHGVREWARRHQAPEKVPGDYLQPPAKGDRVYETMP